MNILELLTNIKNLQRINSLIEDLHEALVGYQVCISTYLLFTMANIYSRLHYKKMSTVRVVSPL